MKRIFTLVLSALLALSLLCLTVNAEPENHLKTQWKANRYKGEIQTSEEDGVTVYTYTPDQKKSWFSPTLAVRNAVKEIVGDRDGADVVFTLEIRAVFEEGYEDSSSSGAVIVRGCEGTKAQGKDAVDEWLALYEEALDGEDPFFTNEGGNIMGRMNGVTFNDSEWTTFVSNDIWISANGNFDESLVKNWELCLDSMRWDGTGLKAIQIRNAGVYDAEEYAEAYKPDPTPTPAPTVQPTTAAPSVTTEAPQATEEAPATEETSTTDPIPVVVCIVCGVAIAAVIVTAIITRKKKG